MKKNNKGFTLIELLAVIVVLAILILLAMPKVTSMMEKARKNSFAVEANEIVKIAQTAYSDKILEGTDAGSITCFTVDQLIDDGYLDKKKNEITGYVKFSTANDSATYTIKSFFVSKGYYIDDTDGEKNGKFVGGNSTKGTKTYTTPDDCTTTTK